MAVIDDFCGEMFKVFEKEKKCFSECFLQLLFAIVPFTLLAMTSSYYTGTLKIPDITINASSQFKIRILSSIMTLALIVFKFLFSYCTNHSTKPVMFLSFIVQGISMLVHCLYLKRLIHVHFMFKYGPFYVIASWMLCFIYFVLEFERNIAVLIYGLKHNDTNSITKVNAACSILINFCQIAYLGSLITGNSKYRTVSLNFGSQNIYPSDTDKTHLFTSDTYSELNSDEGSYECPVESANILSKLIFYWVKPLMKRGSNMTLNRASDLFSLPSDLDTKIIAEKFLERIHYFYDKYCLYLTALPQKNILLRAFNKCFGVVYYLLGLLKLAISTLGFAGPLLLNRLVSFIENPQEDFSAGYYYALGLFLSSLVNSFLSTHYDYQVNKIKIKFRSSLLTTVYDKTLHAKPTDFSTYTIGEITNFMSTDVDRVVNFIPSFHQFFSVILQVILALYLLYLQVNIIFLAGLGLAIIMILFNRYLAVKIGKYNRDMMKYKDERVKIMQELLLGIRVIKFNAYEDRIFEKIEGYRQRELKSLKGIKYFDALCVYMWATTPVIISLLMFSIYSMTGHELTAAKVFTVIALINMLIAPLNAFPWVINGLMEAWVSIKRLNQYVCLQNLVLDQYYDGVIQDEDTVVQLTDASFTWTSSLKTEEGCRANLHDINLEIKQGQLIGVIGTVGSGKSSLLSALSAGIDKVRGNISLRHDNIAFVTQESWIQSKTVKENILWNKEYDEKLYEAALDSCCLQDDLDMLVKGEDTEVGENGVTLSGGQKARISLARAVYQDKEIYLLDDPLSAVDQHVAAHLNENCIEGALALKTRILCTHHTRFLKHADLVVRMKQGRIVEVGQPREVLHDLFDDEKKMNIGKIKQIKKTQSQGKIQKTQNTEVESQMTVEEKDVGTVAGGVYAMYLQSVGYILSFFVLLFLFLMQASKVASDWWLSYWIAHEGNITHINTTSHAIITEVVFLSPMQYSTLFQQSTDSDDTTEQRNNKWYLMVYGCIAAANSCFTLFRAFLFAYGGIKAAAKLHTLILNAVIKAPLSFFHSTPIGRIVNRFSSDMYAIDDALPFILNIFLAQFVGLIGTVVVTCYGFPWFLVAILPLSSFYYYIQHYYRLTSREVKRLNTISLSPIYANFNETVIGLPTISAYNKLNEYSTKNQELINMNQRCVFSGLAAQEWFSIRLQLIGVTMVTSVAFLTVVMHQHNTISPGIAGLALSYALSVTDRLSGVITSFTETEKQMISAERLSYYINNIPTEEELNETSMKQIHNSWPNNGTIVFSHVSLQYRKGLPLAIDNLSLTIEGGEKIGIVGRTGSGKSSILMVLFNMIRPTCGNIFIDGVNTKDIPLDVLRSRLSIIPQDPFLFSGSIRDNLTAAGNYNDLELWSVLEQSGLCQKVEDMGGLDGSVGERGKQFSVGERQLFCLARAMLTKSKIICLDEATGSVDLESDRSIQESIRSCFHGCTILTIAHRIETVMDSDKILVMDAAKLVEYGKVEELMENSSSYFYKLAREGNIIS